MGDDLWGRGLKKQMPFILFLWIDVGGTKQTNECCDVVTEFDDMGDSSLGVST